MEKFSQFQRGTNDLFPRHPGTRVKVKHQLVNPLKIAHRAPPDVVLKRIDLHQFEQTRQILDVDPALLAARIAHFMDGSGRVLDVLLEKTRSVTALWAAQQHQGSINEARQNEIGERAVEIRQLTLGDARLPQQHTVRVSKPHALGARIRPGGMRSAARRAGEADAVGGSFLHAVPAATATAADHPLHPPRARLGRVP